MANDQSIFGNLRANLRNPEAAKANLRGGKLAQTQLGFRPAASGGQVFEAMMAVNESQNQVLGDVLAGPVSQQTQRRLAQLKALNENDPRLNNLAKLNRSQNPSSEARASEARASENRASENRNNSSEASSAKTAAQSDSLKETNNDPRIDAFSAGSRVFGNLQGGRTVKRGLDTGKIFSPSQLSSFRKKNGLARVLYQPPAENSSQAKGEEAASQSIVTLAANLSDSPLSAGARSTSQALRERARNSERSSASQKTSDGQKPSEKLSDKVEVIINKVAGALGLDPSLIKAVVKTESNFNQKAVSSAGAKGLMQLMPKTAKEMGVEDPFNPFENIWGGARYLKKMLDRHGGDLNKALAAYNWGPGNLAKHGSSRMPGETRKYIEVVNRHYARFKKELA